MSLRNIRKLYGGVQLPPPTSDSDDEYEPAYVQKHKKSAFADLAISSHSEDSDEPAIDSSEEEAKPVQKAKKKRRQKKKRAVSDEMDEIDRCVMEVNEMLGEPEVVPQEEPKRDVLGIKKKLFTVKQQFMDPNEELNRRFGPDEEEETKKTGRRPNLRRIANRGFIISTDKVYKRNGLTMTRKVEPDGLIYYNFQHSKEYKKWHGLFVQAYKEIKLGRATDLEFPVRLTQQKMHVEGLIEIADALYHAEDYAAANVLIEEVISYMQHIAHPFFSVTDLRTRLEYKYVENRVFHIALMKYMHMLTNKACHRTALEIAKILMNLDPSDPLAVLFIVDTIAIRAEEHQWLIEAYELWQEERDAGFMFNMQYSVALAHYHVALKMKAKQPKYAKPSKKIILMESLKQQVVMKYTVNNYVIVDHSKDLLRPEDDKDGFEKADELIQRAMLRFPTCLTDILANSGKRIEKIKDCALFNGEISSGISQKLKQLIFLYARFIWHKFTQDTVLKWIVRNVEELIDKFATDSHVQAQAKEYANVNMNLFQTFPREIIRHLSIITPLSALVTDRAVPNVDEIVPFDPAPPVDGINPYESAVLGDAAFHLLQLRGYLRAEEDINEDNNTLSENSTSENASETSNSSELNESENVSGSDDDSDVFIPNEATAAAAFGAERRSFHDDLCETMRVADRHDASVEISEVEEYSLWSAGILTRNRSSFSSDEGPAIDKCSVSEVDSEVFYEFDSTKYGVEYDFQNSENDDNDVDDTSQKESRRNSDLEKNFSDTNQLSVPRHV